MRRAVLPVAAALVLGLGVGAGAVVAARTFAELRALNAAAGDGSSLSSTTVASRRTS